MTPELVASLAANGVRAVALHLQDPDKLLRGDAQRVRRLLDDHRIAVSQSTGYQPNLVHPDAAVRAQGARKLLKALDVAAALGAEMVITGCGSLHASFPYGPHPDNHTADARRRLVDTLRGIAPAAEDRGLLLALECHVMTTLDSPEHIREILDQVGSPSVRANFDPVNLLGGLTDVYDNGSAMRRMWRVIGKGYAPSAHVKDVLPRAQLLLHLDEVAPGDGMLDWSAFFSVCEQLGDDCALIVEHLPADADADAAALSFVHKMAAEHGVKLT